MSRVNSSLASSVFIAFTCCGLVFAPKLAWSDEVQDDALIFVTDEKSGALYECGSQGCSLLAQPIDQNKALADCSSDGSLCEGQLDVLPTPFQTCQSRAADAADELTCL